MALRIEGTQAERCEQAAAAVVGAAAAKSDHESAHAAIEQCDDELAYAAGAAPAHGLRHARGIGEAHHLRHFNDCGAARRVGEQANRRSDRVASGAAHADCLSRAARAHRGQHCIERPLAPVGHRPHARVERGDRPRESARDRRADSGSGERALERIGRDDDTQHGAGTVARTGSEPG